MTDSPPDLAPDAEAPDAEAPDASGDDAAGAADPVAEFAEEVAAVVGSDDFSADHGTVKVRVRPEDWVAAVTKARDELGLDFFSWLSAIDWSREVSVGDPVAEPDKLEERYELMCRLATVTDDRAAIISTGLSRDEPSVDSLVDVFGGAAWHEREAHEMFGIDFRGHPQLVKLYLPDAFEGFPLRKSFRLLSREVKPWPGLVDVEDMPSTENLEAAGPAEAGDAAAGDDAPGDVTDAGAEDGDE